MPEARFNFPKGFLWGTASSAYQVEGNRPTPELANHRTPIKGLYATGAAWHLGANCGATESYNCYKIIAEDMGLGKPWEEKGKEDPDSLIAEHRRLVGRVGEMGKATQGVGI